MLRLLHFVRNDEKPLFGADSILNYTNPPAYVYCVCDQHEHYSLFCFWLVSALKMNESLGLLSRYSSEKEAEDECSQINRLALLLVQRGLGQHKKRSLNLYRLFLKHKSDLNFSYQLFLFFLTFDAWYGKRKWFTFLGALFLRVYEVPCNILAALTIGRLEAGIKTEKLNEKLMGHFCDRTGFRAFDGVDRGDLLSTGVVLFVLKCTGFDLRVIAPVCYSVIERNYHHGAFFSGDGDRSRDLEYTFYGLLGLGCLAGG